jgi:hypothetical protein
MIQSIKGIRQLTHVFGLHKLVGAELNLKFSVIDTLKFMYNLRYIYLHLLLAQVFVAIPNTKSNNKLVLKEDNLDCKTKILYMATQNIGY